MIEIDPDNEKIYKAKLVEIDELITQEQYKQLVGEEQITQEEPEWKKQQTQSTAADSDSASETSDTRYIAIWKSIIN